MSPPALKLFQSYLSNRNASVQDGPFTSGEGYFPDGVPQGSVLGPILFSAAISDIASILGDIHYHMYADDLTMWVSASSPDEVVSKLHALDSALFEFFARKGLVINAKKTQFMYIGSKRKLTNVSDQLLPIEFLTNFIFPTDYIKILGVIFDKHLNYSIHVKSLLGKCISKLRFLYRNAFVLPKESKKLLYNALVAPHLNYCSEVWTHSLTSELQRKLEVVQNSAMRFILGIVDRRCSVALMRNQLGWVTLKDKREVHFLTMCWLATSDCARSPAYLRNMFTPTSAIHGHNTRPRLHVPIVHSSYAKASFSLYGPVVYNKIPLHIRESPSMETFRCNLIKFLRAS